MLISAGVLAAGLLAVVLLMVASGGLGGSNMPAVVASVNPPPPGESRSGRSLGDPEAPVRIDVHEDAQCPACGMFTDQIEPLLVNGPVKDGRVYLTYRDFTFLGPESIDAAVAMRVAEALDGKFWEFHDILFANQWRENKGAFSRPRLAEMAVLVGLDRDAFLAGLDDPALVEAVVEETNAGRALGVSSTPTLVINGTLRPGVPTWQQLSTIIDDLVAQAPE